MNRIVIGGALVIALMTPDVSAQEDRLHTDWAYLARYRDANAALPPPARGEKRVVFLGDSITEGWAQFFGSQFPGKPYVNRGISGQTTPQMLVRFRQDAIALRPAVVVILAGVNDIAGNTGPSTLDMIENNLMSMVDLARANGIAVVLCSVLPANKFSWRPELAPAQDIVQLNRWMKQYAAKHRVTFVDFWTAMADERQGLPRSLSADGVHPNEAGYRVMAPLVERGITKAR
jgi:lysophospholipase L1-like esterase